MNLERSFKGIWIPREIWLTKELSILEKIMLVEIDSLENEERGCYASNKYFSSFFNLTTQRTSQVIQKLKEKGYIDINYIKENNETMERQIKIKKPPYPEVSNKFDTYQENFQRGIKFSLGGYQENFKLNNILSNNININKNNIENDSTMNDIKIIIDYLNQKLGTNYKATTKATKDKINARLNEGFKTDDFIAVIDKKFKEWSGTDMSKYLRPETLFGTKFESYLQQKENNVTNSTVVSKSDRRFYSEEIEKYL